MSQTHRWMSGELNFLVLAASSGVISLLVGRGSSFLSLGNRQLYMALAPSQNTAEDQLQLVRANVQRFTPSALDQKKFKTSPFISGSLRQAEYVFVKDSSLAKSTLQPRHTGPFRVLSRDWHNSMFRLQLPRGPDHVSLERLKAAIPVAS